MSGWLREGFTHADWSLLLLRIRAGPHARFGKEEGIVWRGTKVGMHEITSDYAMQYAELRVGMTEVQNLNFHM